MGDATHFDRIGSELTEAWLVDLFVRRGEEWRAAARASCRTWQGPPARGRSSSTHGNTTRNSPMIMIPPRGAVAVCKALPG